MNCNPRSARIFLAGIFISISGLFLLPTNSFADTPFTSYPVGSGPTYMVATSSMLYVSNTDDTTLTSINVLNSATSSIALGQNPYFIAALGKYLFVAPTNNNELVIDTSNNNSIIIGGTGGSPITGFLAFGTKMFASDYSLNQVQYNDTASALSGQNINVGVAPEGLAASSTMVYVADSGNNSVTMINTASGYTTTTVGLGSLASAPSRVLPLGTKLYVADTGTNLVSVVDLANGNATSTISVGSEPSAMTAIGSKIYIVNANSTFLSVIDTANANATSTINLGYIAQDLFPLGNKLYVSSQSVNYVTSIDTANANATSTINIGTGSDHFALIGSNLYVTGSDNAVHAIDTNTVPGTLAVLTPVPATVSTSSVTFQYTPSYPLYETEALHVGGSCTSGLQVYAGPVVNNATDTIYISNLQPGTTYTCTAYLVDKNGNQSNTLVIGPFVWPSTPTAQATGGSVSGGTIYGCKDPSATNYSEFVASDPAMCVYGSVTTSSTSAATSTASSSAQTSTTTSITAAQSPNIFTRNLQLGMTGIDVKALQEYLNAHGFMVAASGAGSTGNETTYFGKATKTALAKFQSASGIAPAVGYFGPLTRAYIAAHQ